MTAKSLTLQSTFDLKSGQKLPIQGFGVWNSPKDKTVQSCLEALKVGYRHLDTAQIYGNEAEVGEAVRKSGLARKDVFITSKVLKPDSDNASTYQKCLDSIKKIDAEGGYLDLLLIHNVTSGADGVKRLWRAMAQLHQEGKVKSIGVSNMGIGLLQGMKEYANFEPHVNQLELHPWCQQREIVEYCHKNGIAVEAYCPLVRNQKANYTTMKFIAEKHHKTTAHILLRYCLQKAWSPLPKSDDPGRIAQNAALYDFVLEDDDMQKLDAQDQGAD